MDVARLRFGDWLMGFGGVGLLAVMFTDWYELVVAADPDAPAFGDEFWFDAWQAFSVVDIVLATAAVMAIVAVALTAAQPTAAMPLALASLTAIVSLVALVLVVARLIWPPDIDGGELIDTVRLGGAWLGLVATTLLAAGCLASIRDERLPPPEHPVEPRVIEQ